MAINLASKASPKVLERFTQKSVVDGLFSKEYEWNGVNQVRVYSVNTLPLQDYDKTTVNGASRFGNLTEVADTYQEMSITKDKAFNGSIDKGNNTQQLQIKAAGRVLKRQTDEVLIPYRDKHDLKAIANGAGLMKVESNALTKSTIVEAIHTAAAAMSNELVPEDGRVLYIGQTLAIKLKLADEVLKLFQNTAEKAVVNGELGMLANLHVRIIPDSYLPKGVQFMIVKQNVAVSPTKIETMRVLNNQYIVDGAIVQGRLLHDCFVLGNRSNGIYVYTNGNSTAAYPNVVVNATTNVATVTATSDSNLSAYYTLDGSDPKTSSSKTSLTLTGNATTHTATGTVSDVPAGAKIRVYTYANNSLNSGVAYAVNE